MKRANEITPPLKWHGGKHYLASKIIELMPEHTHYVEPYFGGGAVLLAKEPYGYSEVVNDIDYRLTWFWRVLQSPDHFVNFKRAVEAVPFSQEEFNGAVKRLGSSGDHRGWWEKSLDFFIVCRQSLAGRMKDYATLSRTRTRRGMNEQASAWITAVEGLWEVHCRLRQVVILQGEALDVIRSQDGPDTLFYLDPPYLHETRASKQVFAHEMTEDDHRALLMRLCDIKGKFLLSGYRSKLYDTYAKKFGWDRRDFSLPNNAAGGKAKRQMTECVWANYELPEKKRGH